MVVQPNGYDPAKHMFDCCVLGSTYGKIGKYELRRNHTQIEGVGSAHTAQSSVHNPADWSTCKVVWGGGECGHMY